MPSVPAVSPLEPLIAESDGPAMNGEAAAAADPETAALTDPYHYICRASGKGVRPRLAQAFNRWLRIPGEKLEEICAVIQMLHNASLLVDDIEDSSVLRRGRPVAHHIYGVPQTINSANYVYFHALEKTLALGHPKATEVFARQMLELHRGQGAELFWRDTVAPPDEQQYVRMVVRKTGGLFKLAVELMELFSTANIAPGTFDPLIERLGLYFQVRDDLVNLTSSGYAKEKSFAEDLTEGKFSFPIVHALATAPPAQRSEILHILRQRPTEVELKKYCVGLLEAAGSFAYTRSRLAALEAEIQTEVERLGGNEILAALLDSLRSGQEDDKEPVPDAP